jgi:quinol monooxygenase YgiN
MSRFAIFVTVKLKPGSAECHEFHVMQSEGDADTFHFFEVYTSAASLDAHREMPHYKKYIETTKDMIADRAIQRVDVLNHPNVA